LQPTAQKVWADENVQYKKEKMAKGVANPTVNRFSLYEILVHAYTCSMTALEHYWFISHTSEQIQYQVHCFKYADSDPLPDPLSYRSSGRHHENEQALCHQPF
jgi:hypothetical protein